jgi:hypothetical protein
LTTPHACIEAQTVVGPTNLKPAAFRRLDSSREPGVCACQSAVVFGAA